jgi:hypothetical protein
MRVIAAVAAAGLWLFAWPGVQAVAQGTARAAVTVEDPTGALVDPLAPGDDVRVFVFVRRDCPIANRYAPEIARLSDRASAGEASGGRVAVTIVYVDPRDTAALVTDHQREYGLREAWVIDRTHALANAAGATVTPEAAVYSPSREGARHLVYLGRIDDRVESIGRVRPAATTHDLADAIEAARQGRRPSPAAGPAVGCFIADAQ